GADDLAVRVEFRELRHGLCKEGREVLRRNVGGVEWVVAGADQGLHALHVLRNLGEVRCRLSVQLAKLPLGLAEPGRQFLADDSHSLITCCSRTSTSSPSAVAGCDCPSWPRTRPAVLRSTCPRTSPRTADRTFHPPRRRLRDRSGP